MKFNKHIVLLDDHLMQLKLLQRSLESLGAETVSCYDNVDQALAHIKSNVVDLIVCDLSMPNKDGIDMLLMLNEQGFKGDVAIISAMDLPIIATVKSMCEGFTFDLIAEISKPFQLDALQEIVSHKRSPHVHSPCSSYDVSEESFLVGLANGEICNFYQPQVEFNTRKVVGVEALARWRHPTLGILTPDAFLPIVERCNLSCELFDIVVSNAIRDMQAELLPKNVSLNVDQFNLEHACFADTLIKTCNQHNIDPTRLTIEITEEYSYRKSMSLFKNLAKLRINNINISIDDFGTGHSTLENLYSLPFNEIKIDRSFVFNCEHDSKKQQIIKFICGLANEFDIKVVAEGVENSDCWQLLKEMNVDICQGYYISKPVPVDEMKNIMRLDYE
ncbi:EAL domain-containing protein [Vibrio hepatarius]|uniref:EAL domain-containing response regulator n=1 Tax=Vibrio hepatarius TaxID=171383 RepID=UPI003736940B